MDMLAPLLTMIVAFTLGFGWLVLRRLQAEILDRERRTRWVEQLASELGA
jgi:heme exporter protein C